MEQNTEPRRRRRPPQVIIEPEQEPVQELKQEETKPVEIQQEFVNGLPEAQHIISHIEPEKPIKKRTVKKKATKPRKVNAKRSLCQFLSSIILIAYTIYIVKYFFGVSVDTSGESVTMSLGGSIATALVTPHMLFCAIASVFSIAGFIANSRAFALTAAILECVAAVAFVMYAPFLIPSIILGFIGYVRIGSLKERAEAINY